MEPQQHASDRLLAHHGAFHHLLQRVIAELLDPPPLMDTACKTTLIHYLNFSHCRGQKSSQRIFRYKRLADVGGGHAESAAGMSLLELLL